MKSALNKVRTFLARNYGYLNHIQKNKIVIDNFFGKGFGDNPKYITEQLLKNHGDLDIVWILKEECEDEFPDGVRLVKYGTPKAAYEYATAHIWIDNIKNNYKGKKRKEQFYLQTWHGGIAFKKVEKAASEYLDDSYLEASENDSKITDLMISNSDWMTNNYKQNFWYDGEITESGFPRNDVFFTDNSLAKERVYNYFNLPETAKLILYAPTFRDNMSINDQVELYKVNGDAISKACSKKFGGNYVFIERLHPNIADKIGIDETENFKNGSLYPDMQDLLVCSDILITDFSSSVFDFILAKHKVFIFAKDYESYQISERELNFDVKKDLPFPFAGSERQLIDNINQYEDVIENRRVNMLKKRFNIFDDGKASERIAKILVDIIGK